MRRFDISFGDDEIEDVRRRLGQARWPSNPGDVGWRYGVDAHYLAGLTDYWINQYDWRHWEDEINRLSHFQTSIDGFPVHFVLEKGKGRRPMPIILSHGWPWTFWDYHKLILPLADPARFGGDPDDAFDVVVPSLPGFGFSRPVEGPGINFWRSADLWRTLMVDRLGFPRFAAQGGDFGALLTSQLAHKYADDLYGIHLTTVVPLDLFSNDRPWDVFGQALNGAGPEQRSMLLDKDRRVASHMATHILDPQTLAYGISDSPLGLLAWILERRRAWSACGGDVEASFPRDHLITTAMIYWLTNSFGSSVRFYADAMHDPWTPSHDRTPVCDVPTGLSVMLGDPVAFPDPRLEAAYDVRFRQERKGGHFAPYEDPEGLIEDIRATFRPLRKE